MAGRRAGILANLPTNTTASSPDKMAIFPPPAAAATAAAAAAADGRRSTVEDRGSEREALPLAEDPASGAARPPRRRDAPGLRTGGSDVRPF
ncbi:hypothetical protein KM043_006119 [Ampulex compressa]|nr:hypothetical protein KM043_006119 [Ampulex compressa]